MTATPIPPTLRVLLIDDHPVVRAGLRALLDGAGESWVIDEASCGLEALDRLRERIFDVAVVDLSMPGMSGLDLIHRIKDEYPAVALLVLSMHAEEQYALRAYEAGANGYLNKDAAGSELAGAVCKVAGGGTYVTASLAERVVKLLNGSVQVARHARLSERELQVLKHIVRGRRLTEIAAELHLSVKTISTHKARILDKLHLSTTAALIRYGMENGLHGDDASVVMQ